MYTTNNSNVDFNWDKYFNSNLQDRADIPDIDYRMFYARIREILAEDGHLLSLVLGNVVRKLLRNVQVTPRPKILELGAGTGFLTRLLITVYGGQGVLVDNCESSFHAYKRVALKNDNTTYIVEDVFKLEMQERFDFVCSFGLIEHFKDKKRILSIHKKFLKENGMMIVTVPMDSILTRIYYEAYPELNLGYRELLTKKEMLEQLRANELVPLKVEVSQGYVYDFLTVLCK